MELPDRIVFEGPDGFEITEREDIELVFRLASRLGLSPAETVMRALLLVDSATVGTSDVQVVPVTNARPA